MIELTLPFPPSVNRMWRSPRRGSAAGRTILSEPARKYRIACAACVLQQRVPRGAIAGRLHVSIKAYPPDKRQRDLDNLFKGVLDSLQHTGIIENDSHVDKLEIIRCERVPFGEVRITVSNWEQPTPYVDKASERRLWK